jgi:hypothetical protein
MIGRVQSLVFWDLPLKYCSLFHERHMLCYCLNVNVLYNVIITLLLS